MDDSDQNPYSPPTSPAGRGSLSHDDTPAPQARSGFRIAAAVIAIGAICIGIFSFFPFTPRNILFGTFTIIFGLQFVYAAATGRWYAFGQRRQ